MHENSSKYFYPLLLLFIFTHPLFLSMVIADNTTLQAIKYALAHFGFSSSFDVDHNLASAVHDGQGTSACPQAVQGQRY